MTVTRMVVIGGDATGMSAASQALRRAGRDALSVVALERGGHTSYSACGIPYWAGGEVDGPDALVARTPREHRERGIDLRMRTEAAAIDTAGRRVRARALDGGGETWVQYDHLVIATGAVPRRPDVPGIDAEGVYGVQTLDDGQALLDGLATLTDGAAEKGTPRRAVVVGAGYIGVEMAEAMLRRGLDVTVVERADQPMNTLDPDMGALVRDAMVAMGIAVETGAAVREIRTGPAGRVAAVVTDRGEHPADIVVLGLGVAPETTLARAAGLPLGDHGGLLTDDRQRVRGHEGIWAGGDCVEVHHLVSGTSEHVPLGTHANKHGLVIGTNIGGGHATFPGVTGTAVSKVCDLEIGRTGLTEAQARTAGLRYVTATAESTGSAGYYPGARTMTVKMMAERGTGRLLGTQIVGREGAGKRVDIAAVALAAGLTAERVVFLDLGYAPPFSPVWDPVLVAARRTVRALEDA